MIIRTIINNLAKAFVEMLGKQLEMRICVYQEGRVAVIGIKTASLEWLLSIHQPVSSS